MASKLEKIIEDRFSFEPALPAWETEYRFAGHVLHPLTGKPRRWRFDFAWPNYRVAVEAEGGTWVRGAHVRGGKYSKDCRKYNRAALEGWLLLRWTADLIRNEWGWCMEELEEALRKRDPRRTVSLTTADPLPALSDCPPGTVLCIGDEFIRSEDVVAIEGCTITLADRRTQ